MNWPLASFAIVFGVLMGGWFAYERARPSARRAALVATLAAIAALGRDAFVALPDVKPITAITLVVGYALGPLPGFAVGAIGMLASNILLGQGSYTPWQMLAWGLVGVAGALLGRVSGRKANRLVLALACALTAMAAKEIMNVYTWTIGASHTPAALLATAAGGLPFDITDAIASFLFGLAFAPELARLLARMRARMDVRWQAAGTLSSALFLLAFIGALAGGLQDNASAAAVPTAPEIAYLEHAQNSDGGFGAAAGQRSGELYSAWGAMGLAAAGRNPLGVERSGHSVLDSIRAQTSTLEDVGDYERTILALHACGLSIGSFPGDLLGKLLAARSNDGSFGGLVNITTFAIFALRAAGRPPNDPVVRGAGRWLEQQQGSDGGFGFAGRGASEDVDDTAAALQGVIDVGGLQSPAAGRAVAFLRHTQNPDGGYPQQPGGESNAQSTAWAIQGLIAAKQKISAVKRAGSRSPLAYLQSLVAPNGSVRYSRTSTQTPVWVTAQALTALAGRVFPISPVSKSGRTARSGEVMKSHVIVDAPRAVRPLAVHSPRRSSSTRSHLHPLFRAKPSRERASHEDSSNAKASDANVPFFAQSQLDAIAHTAGVLVALLLAPMLS